jgi:hypothetical protein
MAIDLTLETINARFNEELQQQISGTLPIGHVYKLGNPLAILQSIGIPDFPIEMTSSKLDEKSQKRGHEFDLSDAANLPQAIQNPIAVFSYGDKSKAVNVITEIEKNGKKFLVGISINPEVDGKKLEINSVRSIFPKNSSEWLNWIVQDKSLYINKEKIQTLINQQRTTLADVGYLDLDSATKIVQDFENPKFLEEKSNISKAAPSKALQQIIDNTQTTTKKQIDMKKTLTLALLLAAAVCGAQTHFPQNFNVNLKP